MFKQLCVGVILSWLTVFPVHAVDAVDVNQVTSQDWADLKSLKIKLKNVAKIKKIKKYCYEKKGIASLRTCIPKLKFYKVGGRGVQPTSCYACKLEGGFWGGLAGDSASCLPC